VVVDIGQTPSLGFDGGFFLFENVVAMNVVKAPVPVALAATIAAVEIHTGHMDSSSGS
jgi:hypothetical protein